MLTPLKRVSRYFTDKKRHARSRRIATTPFYRAHPYSGPVRLASLDSRVAIDFELGFLYNRVLKAANTTIIATLASLKNESGDNPKDLFRKPSDLTEAETQQVPSLFRFAFVRNPYSRTLSAYLDKIARGNGIVDRQLHRTGANTLIADHYSGECQRIVSSLFQEDFTAFGYSPSLPNH